MHDEAGFLAAIRANPGDDASRLVYADWLDERGDDRGQFIRLHLALTTLAPDHVHRVEGEGELSRIRKNCGSGWLGIVEPERPQGAASINSCLCFNTAYRSARLREVTFHVETQDTECDGWKKLLDLVEEAAADGRAEFTPRRHLTEEQWAQIVTLPATIAKLKAVKHLLLYGSDLGRIPPEIGEMTALERFTPYTSYRLHWFPYEMTRCKKLRDSTVSTRALYGSSSYRSPFPRLQPRTTLPNGRVEPEGLSLKYGAVSSVRNCSVCDRPFEDKRQHRVWISLRVATDVLPLLVNACSEECIRNLPTPPDGYVNRPHRGGLDVEQPPRRF